MRFSRAAGRVRRLHLDDRRGSTKGVGVANRAGGIGLGGILVIIGIVVAFAWSLWLGIIIALVGLLAFGGFAKGKWY